MSYHSDADAMRDALARTPNWDRVRGPVDDAMLVSILNEAVKIAENVVHPLNVISDRQGAVFENGSVRVPTEFQAAFDQISQGGWMGLEHSEEFGGMGMPLAVFAATDPLFERACPAFMMSVGGARAAALVLADYADADLRDEWVPALISGERCATICISEAGAGSDVGRITTRATADGSGGWTLSGQKIWISFGDHDIRERIGHCILARTGTEPGSRGLSLFLVERGPNVRCERIEEKLGLHGSPTCVLQFENAPAHLIGQEGRGLSQLFSMIRHMRLMVACQGLGAATQCYDIALEHAQERRQGGNPKEDPVPIIHHPDVQRQLFDIKSAIDLFRLAMIETACAADLSAENPEYAAFTAWMLPLIKNFGAELGYEVAGKAILVLGGSGYTQDYALEQILRDARITAIYEGTTGMQAQDFFLRQTKQNDGLALKFFLERAINDTAEFPRHRTILEKFSQFIYDAQEIADKNQQAWMCDAVMRAGWVAVQTWLSIRIDGTEEANHFMTTAQAQLDLHVAAARLP
jgi:alkylation response protein AidB-like acyl-CoA dehydrogenase